MKKYADLLQGEVLDLREELTLVSPKDTPLVSMLYGTNKVVPCTDITVSWREKQLNTTRGELKLEGADASDAIKSTRAMYTNICQIVERGIAVSGTMGALKPHGVGDEYTSELNDRLAEIKIDLEYYFLNGAKAVESESTPRQMNGLFNMVANTLDKTDKGKLTLADLEDCMQLMWNKGCNGDIYLFVNATEKRAINKFLLENNFRIVAQVLDSKIGVKVDTVDTDFGTINIVLDRHIPTGTVLGIDLEMVEVGELRPIFHELLAKTGDSTKGHILVENTIKLLNQYAGFKILNISE